MIWTVHYLERRSNSNATSRAFASKEEALRHACDLSYQKCVVYYVKGPNEERIDAVAITAWCKRHTTPTKPPDTSLAKFDNPVISPREGLNEP
jgi:hypothetical protein